MILRCEDYFVIVKGFLGVLIWLVCMFRRILLFDFCFFILGDGFFSLLVCMFNSILLLDFCLFILGECFFLVKLWLVFMLRVWMILGFNLCWLVGELGVIGRSFLICVDLFLFVGDWGVFFVLFLVFFFFKLGEVGLDEIFLKLIFVEIVWCWGEDDVLFGISFCKVLYKFCILLIDVDMWCFFNMVVVCLGFIFDGSVICFLFWGIVGDGIFVKMREKNKNDFLY